MVKVLVSPVTAPPKMLSDPRPVVPTCRLYCVTPAPVVHVKVAVDPVSAPPETGEVMAAGCVSKSVPLPAIDCTEPAWFRLLSVSETVSLSGVLAPIKDEGSGEKSMLSVQVATAARGVDELQSVAAPAASGKSGG